MTTYSQSDIDQITETMDLFGGTMDYSLPPPTQNHIFNCFMKLVTNSVGVEKYIFLVRSFGNIHNFKKISL